MALSDRLAPYRVSDRRQRRECPGYGVHVTELGQELKRFPDCACGETYWDGHRWRQLPDRSAYEDPPEM